MMYNNPALMHSILSHMADSIGAYACYQVRCSTDIGAAAAEDDDRCG